MKRLMLLVFPFALACLWAEDLSGVERVPMQSKSEIVFRTPIPDREPPPDKRIYLDMGSPFGISLYETLKGDGWEVFDASFASDMTNYVEREQQNLRRFERAVSAPFLMLKYSPAGPSRAGREAPKNGFVSLHDLRTGKCTLMLRFDRNGQPEVFEALKSGLRDAVIVRYGRRSMTLQVADDGMVAFENRKMPMDEAKGFLAGLKPPRDTQWGFKIEGGKPFVTIRAPARLGAAAVDGLVCAANSGGWAEVRACRVYALRTVPEG